MPMEPMHDDTILYHRLRACAQQIRKGSVFRLFQKSSKFQHPNSRETSILKSQNRKPVRLWSSGFGISLDVGAWILDFLRKMNANHGNELLCPRCQLPL